MLESPSTSPPPSRPSVRTLWLTGTAGALVVAAFCVLAATSERLPERSVGVFIVIWISGPYLVSGLIAWRRRPVSRLGPLMLVAGFVTPLALLPFAENETLHSIGELFQVILAAIYLHVFLAYPTGRLRGALERFTVVSCYVAALVPTWVRIMLGHDPGNVFTVAVNPVAALWVAQVQFWAIAALLLFGATLLYLRRRAAGRPRRRFAALLVDAFGLCLVSLAVLSLGSIHPSPGIGLVNAVTSAVLGLAPVAFLIGLLDMRMARTDIGGLLVELDRDPTVDLQAPLARALHDPSLQLAYWLPDGRWADQNGQIVTLPGPDQKRSVRVIYRDQQPVAALFFDPSLDDEHELLNAVSAAAGIALENGRLKAELRAKLHEVQSSRRWALEAGRQERQRLERNLHDGAQQRLVGISIELGLLENRMSTDTQVKQQLAKTRQEVSESLNQLREIAHGIYPAVLSGHGLAVALESLTARAAVPVSLRVEMSERLPEPVEVAAYYIVSESLANIGKHARANAATVSVERQAELVIVEITDDGIGGANQAGGSGLRGLSDRAEVLGGRVLVQTPAGGGTTIRAEIPCAS